MNGRKLRRRSSTRLRVGVVAGLLLGSVGCVCAAMVPIATGASSREAARVYADRYSVSVATAERWVREQERKTGVRLVDTLNLPEGARLDFAEESRVFESDTDLAGEGGNELSIHGEVKERERTGILRRSTRQVGQFEYRVTLPADVDPDQVNATLRDGVLRVEVAKTEATQPRRIQITKG